MAASYECPFCHLISYHPRDLREKYCAACHVFATDVLERLETAIRNDVSSGYDTIQIGGDILIPVLQALTEWVPTHRGPAFQTTAGTEIRFARLPLVMATHAADRIRKLTAV